MNEEEIKKIVCEIFQTIWTNRDNFEFTVPHRCEIENWNENRKVEIAAGHIYLRGKQSLSFGECDVCSAKIPCKCGLHRFHFTEASTHIFVTFCRDDLRHFYGSFIWLWEIKWKNVRKWNFYFISATTTTTTIDFHLNVAKWEVRNHVHI